MFILPRFVNATTYIRLVFKQDLNIQSNAAGLTANIRTVSEYYTTELSLIIALE